MEDIGKKLTGRAKGGAARQAALTPEQRRENASKAAIAKTELARLPKVTHRGEIRIGEACIPCVVLENGSRLITESGMSESMLGGRSGASKRIKKRASESDGPQLPIFVAPGQLKPFIDKELECGPLQGVRYNDEGRALLGFDAVLLPKVCDIWLKARHAGALQSQQLAKAQKAEVLMRGLAHVGIIALVDEATGYQKDRAKDALAKILEAYVAKELQPWVKTFDADYYENMFRLRGLEYPPENPSFRPQYFGKLTNDIVYRRLAPGVLSALKEENSKAERKGRLHQHLTAGFGRQSLTKHLGKVVALMQVSDQWPDFMSKLNRVVPRYGDTIELGLDDDDR